MQPARHGYDMLLPFVMLLSLPLHVDATVVMAEQSTRASKLAVIASNFYISTLTLDLSESRVPKYCDS